MGELDGRLFRRVGNRLEPADLVSQEMLDGIKDGETVVLSYRKTRSAKNHAHYHVLLRAALDHLEGFTDVDSLGDTLKIAVGFVRPIVDFDGRVRLIPKSIAEAALGEDEFKRFKNRAIWKLNEQLGFDIVEYAEENYRRRNPNARVSRSFDIDERPSPPPEAYGEKNE